MEPSLGVGQRPLSAGLRPFPTVPFHSQRGCISSLVPAFPSAQPSPPACAP